MRISDWSSDVCSSDLLDRSRSAASDHRPRLEAASGQPGNPWTAPRGTPAVPGFSGREKCHHRRSEEHTSELQSLMRISYAVFCLKKKNTDQTNQIEDNDIYI